MCSTLTPSGFTIAWCSGAAHTDVPFWQHFLSMFMLSLLFLSWMSWAVHCTLTFKAVWFAKHAGWSGYTTGMAGETSLWHGCWRYPLLSQHVGSLFFCLFSCTFFHHRHHFFHDHDEWPLLVCGCIYDWKGSLIASRLFFLWKKKKCLPVSVRGYCMLHGWIMTCRCHLGSFFTLSVNIPWVPLGSSYFVFDVLRDWCMMGAFLRGQLKGMRLPWEVWCHFLMLQKKLTVKFQTCEMDGKKNKKIKKMLFCLHTHLHPPLLKKNTRSHGSAFCCDILFFFFYLSAWAQISVANGLGDQTDHDFCHLLWLLILKSRFSFFLFLFLLATKASLHGRDCPALLSVSVCGCAELEIWRAERE